MDKEISNQDKAYIFGIVTNLRIISRLYSIIYKENSIEKTYEHFFNEINSKTSFLLNLWAKCNFGCSMYNFSDELQEIENTARNAAKGMEDKNDYDISYDITKLLPHLLSSVTLLNSKRENVYLPVDEFNDKNIFPSDKHYSKQEIENKYKDLFSDVITAVIKVLNNADKDKSLLMTTAALDSVFFRYLSNIPAFYTGDNDDVSLYEYAKVVSAFACVIYNQKKIINNDKFALIRGDFFSIQSFIFNKGAASKNSANSLRGKSFYVSLMSDIAAISMLDKLHLPYFNLMMNAAGQFVILSNYSDNIKKVIENLRDEIDNWLYNKYYASVSMGLSVLPCELNDFNSNEFNKLILKLLEEKEKAKSCRFNLPARENFVFNKYCDKFIDSSTKCEYCGVIPKVNGGDGACENCSIYIQYGRQLRQSKYLYVIEKSHPANIFDKYEISFDDKNRRDAFIRMHIDMQDITLDEYNYCDVIHYKSYVAVDKFDDGHDEIRSFSNIAKYSPDGKGADILAVLKADVDNLGLIFACGLSEKDGSGRVTKGKLTFSKTNMLSRSIHNFFSYHLYGLMKDMNIYTVFAGGDDLFLVGRYNSILEFAKILHDEFNKFTNNNQEVTISAGIGFYNDGTPVWFMAEDAEHRLEKAKQYRDKDKKDSILKGNISLLYGQYNYKTFLEEYERFQEKILYFDKYVDVSKGLLYKLMYYCDMKMEYEKEINEKSSNINLNNLLWRSHFHYVLGRMNIKNYPKNINNKEFSEAIKNEISTYFTEFIENNANLLKTLIALKLYNERN